MASRTGKNMNAEQLQEQENRGRRRAQALLAIGESTDQVKTDALKKGGLTVTSFRILAKSTSWRYSVRIENSMADDCAFLAGVFAACEESTP